MLTIDASLLCLTHHLILTWQRLRQRLIRTLPTALSYREVAVISTRLLPIESSQGYLKVFGLLQLVAERLPSLESKSSFVAWGNPSVCQKMCPR